MIHVLFAAFLMTAAPDDTIPPIQEQADTLIPAHERVDTLKEVEVVAPGRTSGIEDAIRQSLQRMGVPRSMSLGDVINKISPGLTDKILHPFAIKERKRAKRQKKVKKILDDFDKSKTFDELVREALEREGIVLPPRKEDAE